MKLWDNSHAKIEINADIPISFYVMKNKFNSNNKTTKIISELNRSKLKSTSCIYLNPNYSIPLACHSVFEKLIKLIESNEKYKLQIKTKTVKSKGEQFKLPNKYSSKDMYGIDTYRIKDGYFVKKIIEEHPDMKKTKLIIANKASLNGSIIDDGRLGLTGNDKYYILGEKLDNLQKLFESKIGNIISKYTKYRQDFLEKDAFEYLPDVRYIPKKDLPDITDKSLYKLLKLNDDEIKLIENIQILN
jgi:hypothetical protein